MGKEPKAHDPATCLHCESLCRLTTGKEVYPNFLKLHEKHIYVCDHCDARVGCHGDTTRPLGYAANKETRNARMKLHNLKLDPLWKKVPRPERKAARSGVYRYLAQALRIEPRDCHTGMFTIERCRDAWRTLNGQTPATIRQWNDAHRIAAQEAGNDRKRHKSGRQRRRAF